MKIDWRYPLIFGVDLKSHYKSIWMGWWLVTWCSPWEWWRIEDVHIAFQPGP